MKRSTLLASTAALLLSAGVAVAAGEAAKQQPANDMPPPPHGDRPKPHHSDKMRNKFKRDSLPRGFDELGLSEVQKNKIRDIMAQHRPRQPENTPARRAGTPARRTRIANAPSPPRRLPSANSGATAKIHGAAKTATPTLRRAHGAPPAAASPNR